jgi:hypothetical protein
MLARSTQSHLQPLAAPLAVALALFTATATLAEGVLDPSEWRFEERIALPLAPDLPADLPVQLILDDDSIEGAFGVTDPTGLDRQFLWFNQFALDGFSQVQLEEIWVLFLDGAGVAPGDAVELVAFHDGDGDPATGATFLGSWNETVQVVDGATFSVYPLPEPLDLPLGGNVLIGVVPRFIESGVTGSTLPAALDTTASQGRSWVAIWTGDPPSPPTLPPDLFLDRVDVLTPGNFAVRAFGTVQPVIDVPTLDLRGIALLALLLAGLGSILLSRKG